MSSASCLRFGTKYRYLWVSKTCYQGAKVRFFFFPPYKVQTLSQHFILLQPCIFRTIRIFFRQTRRCFQALCCMLHVSIKYSQLVPMTVLGQAWVCSRQIAEILGPNPAEGDHIRLLCILWVVQVVVSETSWSLVQRNHTVCVRVCVSNCMESRNLNNEVI